MEEMIDQDIQKQEKRLRQEIDCLSIMEDMEDW
jgi:hypothetical protein